MKRLYIFLIIGSFILILSCKKEEKLPDLDKEFEEYFAPGKDGSWWVYINKRTAETDSHYVSGWGTSKYEFSDPPKREIQFYLHSSRFERKLIRMYGDEKRVEREMIFPVGGWARVIKENGEYKFDEYSGRNAKPIFIDTEINGINYNRVLLLEQLQTTSYNYFYHARNIGIIQFIKGKDTFSLIRYHINK